MYNVRIKPNNETNSWVEVYNPDNEYPIQSNSDYTTISLSIEGQMDSPLNTIAGTQSDIQVEALIGYVHRVVIGFGAPWFFNGTESGWSNTQTVSIPANVPLNSPSTRSTPIGNTPTTSFWIMTTTISVIVIALLLAVIIILLIHSRKRRII